MTILRFIQLGLLEEDGVNIGKEDTDKEGVHRGGKKILQASTKKKRGMM
jgi:hypothetical protein